ncbi:PEP-CTERM sorting domain-containing protein [Tautonia rosea]|uniref:PEP-CTERM sorting domain-containing protein n=1 Tax=Tautonia rosea TaxID=2728037 RepID=UPI001473558F|nr:PEP-CTERM sorting domain-containing protein [Tautonia rosea]
MHRLNDPIGFLNGLGLIAVLLLGSEGRSEFVVTEYARLPRTPTQLTFGSDGSLYAGSSATDGADIGPSWVYRIAPGGTSVTRFGNEQINDPDAVLFDAEGRISGVAGSVLVGGLAPWNGVQNRGRLSAIRPNGTINFINTLQFTNPHQMAFDSTGRMLLTDIGESRSVFALTREPGSNLQITRLIEFNSFGTSPTGLAIGPGDQIFTSHRDGVIRVHNADGTLVNNAFATLFDPSSVPPQGQLRTLAFAPGGMFGTDLYTQGLAGEIVRIDASGQTEIILSGLGPIGGMTFGPDGALYLADPLNDRILRVTPTVIPEPSSLLLVGLGGLAVVGVQLRQRSRRLGGSRPR